MLGKAEFRIHGQQHLGLGAACDVVAGNLAFVVRPGVHEDHSPVEGYVLQSGFFADLADRRFNGFLARLNQALREIPVAIGAQQKKLEFPVGHAHHHDPGGESCGRCN